MQHALAQIQAPLMRDEPAVAMSNGLSSTSRRISLPSVTLIIVWPASGLPYAASA
jgi:hypothetical protein